MVVPWEYGGLLFSDEIGNLSVLYEEKELEQSVLKLLIRNILRKSAKERPRLEIVDEFC